MRKSIKSVFFTVFVVFVGCSQASQPANLKVATYNIFFLDDGISSERKENLQKVLESLDADIIGFQEINNVAALKNILPENYSIAMPDAPDEVQELAVAVRPPVRIKSFGYVFPDPDLDEAFPRSRDLLQVVLDAYGSELVVLVHHAKSRRGGRLNTDSQREQAAQLIVRHIRGPLSGRNVILLGDFNDNPDDRSVNILEYGDPNAAAGIDSQEDTFLFNTSEALAAKDYCSYGYSYIYGEVQADTFALVVAGAREENNKWRGIEHDFYRDVEIKANLIDQILVSLTLKEAVEQAGVFNKSVAVLGELSRIRFDDGQLQYTKRGSLASDHVPVWVRLRLE